MKVLVSYDVSRAIEIEDSEIQAITKGDYIEIDKLRSLFLQYGVDPQGILGDEYESVITGVYAFDDGFINEILWEY